jgi:GTP 3',8-cyclase
MASACPLSPLADRFGRRITYVRVSVTDRCDLRCVYCMPERMHFLPKADVLTLEEIDRLCAVFVRNGVRKIRLTGGEPLVRRGVLDLINNLSRHLKSGDIDELTLTTNGTRLAEFADALATAGMRRVNISLDTLDRETFTRIARDNRLDAVLEGIAAARAAGLSVKINTVALKHDNAAEIPHLIEWAHGHGMDLTLIEVMPLGETGEARTDQHVPLPEIRRALERRWALVELPDRTGGPARYVRVTETGGRLGFITPLSDNFCASCNRVRLTATGQLYMCLGHEDHVDLRAPLRAGASEDDLDAVYAAALGRKPKAHEFSIPPRSRAPTLRRHMSVTGG